MHMMNNKRRRRNDQEEKLRLDNYREQQLNELRERFKEMKNAN